MYPSTYSVADQYVHAQQAELARMTAHYHPLPCPVDNPTKHSGQAVNKLAQGLSNIGKLFRSKLAHDC